MAYDWEHIKKCELIKILGATECNNCSNLAKCWGEEAILPEPATNEGLVILEQVLKETSK